MKITESNPYVANGFKNRQEYLNSLAEEYGESVYVLADVLGPSEDFDGLVSHCEDLEDDF